MRARESKVRERGLPTTEYWNVCRGGGEVGGEVSATGFVVGTERTGL